MDAARRLEKARGNVGARLGKSIRGFKGGLYIVCKKPAA